jgi:hypothetical protein
MRRLTPSALELEKAADVLIADSTLEERQQWLSSRFSKAVFVLLEAARMKAFEMIESGPEHEKLVQFMAQAQLADYLMDELADYMSGVPNDEHDEH